MYNLLSWKKQENRARTARELRELLLAVNEEIGKAWSEVGH